MTLLKRKPKAPPARWVRARAAINSHPKIAWGTLAAIFGILGIVVPWVISWEARYQRKVEAEAEISKLRADTQAEAKAHEKVDRRADAWQGVGLSRIEVLILRNRVNECNVARAGKATMTALEINVCQQYDDELRQGQARYERSASDAKALSQ